MNIKEKATYAFPTGDHNNFTGMTLRDWFAGQALVGLYANPGTMDLSSGMIAATAYSMADAMMKERAL
jgi:hypothetical protein